MFKKLLNLFKRKCPQCHKPFEWCNTEPGNPEFKFYYHFKPGIPLKTDRIVVHIGRIK